MWIKRSLLSAMFGICATAALGYGDAKPGFKKPPMDAHPYASAKSITGKIAIGDNLKAEKDIFKFDDNDVIYVIVNKHGVKAGAPVAVKKIDSLKDKKFPMEFTVGAADTMAGHDATFVGPFSVKIKLSRTGDAMSSPGDLIGYSSDTPINVGAKNIEVKLTEMVGHSKMMPK